MRAGILATLVDAIGGGLAAYAAAPGWIATADLDLQLFGTLTGLSAVDAIGRVLRRALHGRARSTYGGGHRRAGSGSRR